MMCVFVCPEEVEEASSAAASANHRVSCGIQGRCGNQIHSSPFECSGRGGYRATHLQTCPNCLPIAVCQ